MLGRTGDAELFLGPSSLLWTELRFLQLPPSVVTLKLRRMWEVRFLMVPQVSSLPFFSGKVTEVDCLWHMPRGANSHQEYGMYLLGSFPQSP